VSKGHDNLGTARSRPQVLDDLHPQRRRGISRERRDPLGIEEDHSGPADSLLLAVRAVELHDEEIPLVIE
jgi:hypothetical protein